jgi:DNA helicase-2/ATP-dependent DNA helicase PcrA
MFLTELYEIALGHPELIIEQWAPEPAEGETNPVTAQPRTEHWPIDPLGERHDEVHAGAALVEQALEALSREPEPEPGPDPREPGPDGPADPGEGVDPDDPEGWATDVTVLLAERARARAARPEVALPATVSVSQLVELAADPEALAARLRRPMPFPPNPHARRGTAFHAWLEQRFGATRLLDLDELPGAADDGASPDHDLEELRTAFLSSSWADRRPAEVEVPFETEIDGIGVRGRMDAVFADPDGGWTVVDWKTGPLPDPSRLPALSVQLAAYRLAWAALAGCPVEQVRAAFHFVRAGETLRPADLLEAEGLRALLRGLPASASIRPGGG